jgi:putative ABC transport system permease protein
MFLALKEFSHAKVRYALVMFVIAMVASLVFILSGLANGLASGNSEAIDAIDADGFVVGAGSEFLLDRSRLSPEVVSAVQEADGVDEAQPFAAFAGNMRNADSEDVIGISILAVPVDTFLDPGVTSGNRLADSSDGVVIDQSLVDEGIALGDTIVLEPSGVELEVVGITDGHQYRLAPTLMVNLDKLGEINPDSDGTVGAIAVRGDANAIEALPDSIDDITVGSQSDLIQGLPGYQEQRGTLLLIQVFLVVIAAGIIAAFFFILTLQKMSELGVMKALGATTWVLAKALIIQAIILGVVGILVGISAGCIVQILAEGFVPYQVQWQQMALYGSILLVVAIVGTMLSLIRIARVDPLDAINRVN